MRNFILIITSIITLSCHAQSVKTSNDENHTDAKKISCGLSEGSFYLVGIERDGEKFLHVKLEFPDKRWINKGAEVVFTFSNNSQSSAKCVETEIPNKNNTRYFVVATYSINQDALKDISTNRIDEINFVLGDMLKRYSISKKNDLKIKEVVNHIL